MRTRNIVVVALLALALNACATQAYREATSPEGFGYHNAPLEEGRYRITFRGRDFATAYDFALLRAAEVTLQQGYEWFRITDAFSQERNEYYPSSHLSFDYGYGHYGRYGYGRHRYFGYGHRGHNGYGRHGYYGPQWGLGLSFPIGDSYQTVVHSLDIQMGRGDRPDGERVYDATSVKATIGPRAYAAR